VSIQLLAADGSEDDEAEPTKKKQPTKRVGSNAFNFIGLIIL